MYKLDYCPFLSIPYVAIPGAVCSNGDVRLVGGVVDSEGTVELCREGQWGGTICDFGWGVPDAEVICRQLGYETKGR